MTRCSGLMIDDTAEANQRQHVEKTHPSIFNAWDHLLIKKNAVPTCNDDAALITFYSQNTQQCQGFLLPTQQKKIQLRIAVESPACSGLKHGGRCWRFSPGIQASTPTPACKEILFCLFLLHIPHVLKGQMAPRDEIRGSHINTASLQALQGVALWQSWATLAWDSQRPTPKKSPSQLTCDKIQRLHPFFGRRKTKCGPMFLLEFYSGLGGQLCGCVAWLCHMTSWQQCTWHPIF